MTHSAILHNNTVTITITIIKLNVAITITLPLLAGRGGARQARANIKRLFLFVQSTIQELDREWSERGRERERERRSQIRTPSVTAC